MSARTSLRLSSYQRPTRNHDWFLGTSKFVYQIFLFYFHCHQSPAQPTPSVHRSVLCTLRTGCLPVQFSYNRLARSVPSMNINITRCGYLLDCHFTQTWNKHHLLATEKSARLCDIFTLAEWPFYSISYSHIYDTSCRVLRGRGLRSQSEEVAKGAGELTYRAIYPLSLCPLMNDSLCICIGLARPGK